MFFCFIIAPGSCTFILHFSQVTKGKIVLFKYEFKGLKCLLFIRCWNVFINNGWNIFGYLRVGYNENDMSWIFHVRVWMHTFCRNLNPYLLSYFECTLPVILWTHTFCHTLNAYFLFKDAQYRSKFVQWDD